MNSTAKMGHNNPPPSPFEAAAEKIETLHVEAKNWLDGEAIENQAQADEVSKLLDMARNAKKEADAARKEEAKPFDDGKKEVQARYKPLLDRADAIADLCKKVIAPFIAKVEAEKREAERSAPEKAEAARTAAAEAYAAAQPTDCGSTGVTRSGRTTCSR